MKNLGKKVTAAIICAALASSAFGLAACNGAYVDKLSVKGQTSYMTGDEFAGATLTVTYSDGKREQIEVTQDMLGGFDTSVAGNKTVIIGYAGKTVKFEITVSDMYASSIIVDEDSVAEYIVNSAYTDGDAKITVLYTDGTTESKTVTADMISGFDTTTDGKKTLSVKYGELAASYEITVRYPYVTSATVSENTKRVYRVGDKFDKIVLDVNYEDGTSGVVTFADVNDVKGFDTSTVGNYTLKVTHRNRTVGVDIEVKKALKNVAIGDETKKIYTVGDKFDRADLVLTYTDDTQETLSVTEDMLGNFDTSAAGNKTIDIDFEGRKLSYAITVAGKFIDNGEVNKIQVEDGTFVDMSAVQVQSVGNNMFENTTTLEDGSKASNGADGKSTANISVKGNKIVIRFIAESAGTYKLGLRAQSCENSGRGDLNIQNAFKVSVNGEEASISGTIGKATDSATGWRNMTKWTELDICEIAVKAGLNEIEFAFLGETALTPRLPNIDYFTLTAV